MKKALRNSVTAIWLGWIGMGIVAKANEPDKNPRLFVCVRNYAKVSSQNMRYAEKVAKRIFARAGVETTWEDYIPSSNDTELSREGKFSHCASMLPTMDVNLTNDHAGLSLADDVLGMAPGTDEGGHIVYVFADVADKVMEYPQTAERSDILGHAIAHEIGHILTHVVKHSPTGLMRATWQEEDFRAMAQLRLNFNSEQAARIREEVTIRTHEQALLKLSANSLDHK
jgi:hypothetical protein